MAGKLRISDKGFMKVFVTLIPDENGCKIWPGKSKKGPYRRAFMFFNGYLTPELDVCHKCDNPRCVEPSHLWEGTRSDNIRDMYSKCRGNSQLHPESLPRGDKHWTRCQPEKMKLLAMARSGENSHRATMKNSDVAKMRFLWASGKFKTRKMLFEYLGIKSKYSILRGCSYTEAQIVQI